ncbi:MAG: type II toxin-antitoxin system MqsA family antitoxin [Coriobacteriia bacterium]|nr:type II toxin-antitoxin system MqsA family antitoxin [Coriobacteriia bacterium]
MYPKRCGACGGRVAPSTGALPFSVRGETVKVPGIEHGVCADCSEVYLALDAAEQLQTEAIRMSKAARGLLAPDEIREIRRSFAMSQVAFEELLGVGSKTVVRWEKGTVFQSTTADRLMRLLRAQPELAMVLASGELYARACASAERVRI